MMAQRDRRTEPGERRDHLDRSIGRLEQPARQRKTLVDQPTQSRSARCHPELAREIARAHRDSARQGGDGVAFVQALPHPGDQILQARFAPGGRNRLFDELRLAAAPVRRHNQAFCHSIRDLGAAPSPQEVKATVYGGDGAGRCHDAPFVNV